jgi:hypothetical protein
VDLSGVIFVVLALGWAAYLIPMALKRHDDEAMTRPVETFSDAVRVLGRGAPAPVADVPATLTAETPQPAPARVHTVTRASARRAAKRRRRVLSVLLLTLVAVSVTSYLGYSPWWSTAAPGGLIVAFLVIARLSVRAQQVRRAAPVQQETRESASAVEPSHSQATAPAEVEPDLGREDTMGLSRDELAAAVAQPSLDEGSLWDPLPVTLPTYVNKARARRTVRTVEITGMTSSGHDAADSALAREADAARAEAALAEAALEPEVEADGRKAAGA